MINLIRSEWVKFRSVRSTLILVIAAGLLVVLIAFFAARDENGDQGPRYCQRQVAGQTVDPGTTGAGGVAQDPNLDGPVAQGPGDGTGSTGTEIVECSSLPGYESPSTHLGDLTVGLPFALFLLGAFGVQVIGQEYRFNTIRPTFTAMPRRGRVLVAKLVVVTLACAAVSVVMLALCALVGTVVADRFTIDELDHRVILGTILFTMGWSAMGMGVGAILRQPVAGILVLVGEALVIEQILSGLFDWTAPYLPFTNGIQMTIRDEVLSSDGEQVYRTVLGGGVYFFIVTAVVWGIGAVLANRRDA